MPHGTKEKIGFHGSPGMGTVRVLVASAAMLAAWRPGAGRAGRAGVRGRGRRGDDARDALRAAGHGLHRHGGERRGRHPGGIALAAPLVFLLPVLFAAPARAQTVETLVSNLSNGGSTNQIWRSEPIAQRFNTGTNRAGYLLRTVEIKSLDPEGDSFSAKVCTVTGDDQPTSTCTDLTPPATFAAGDLTFTVPTTDGMHLAANTKYTLVLTPPADTTVVYGATSLATEHSKLDGWNIAGEFRDESDGSWGKPTGLLQSNPLRIRLKGTQDTDSTYATLSDLELQDTSDDSDIALSPTFATATTSYTAMVANDVDTILVDPTTSDDGATIEYLDAEDMDIPDAGTADGQQVALVLGDNTIKVKVTAGDTMTIETYAVVVTREPNAATGEPRVIDAEPYVDKTLTANTGTIADDDGLTKADNGDPGYAYRYQWIRGSADITNATDSTYTLTADDEGNTVKVRVSFRDDADNDESRTSFKFPNFGTIRSAVTPTTLSDDAVTLVSNLGVTGTHNSQLGGGNARWRMAQKFTVRAGTDYIVQEVKVVINGSNLGVSAAIHAAHTNNTNNPGDYLYGLVRTSTGTSGRLTLAPPADAILAGGTSYFIVLNGPHTSRQAWVSTSDAEDGASLSGWTIANGRRDQRVGDGWVGNTRVVRIGLFGVSADAALSALEFTDTGGNAITLTPEFAPDSLDYTVTVSSDVDTITVAPTLNDTTATFEFIDGSLNDLPDADNVKPGHQVALAEGQNFVKVRVTAQDGMTERIYKTMFWRQSPPVVTSTEGELWSATLNIAEPDGEDGPEGYCTASACSGGSHSGFGSVSDSTFELGGTTYTVTSVRFGVSSSELNPYLWFSTSTALGDDAANLQLHIGTNVYIFSDAETRQSGKRYGWTLEFDRSKGPWPEPGAGATAAVKLVELDANAATGVPTISGTPQVGKTLTANTGGISDANGNANAEAGESGYAYSYQWIRVDVDGESNPVDIGSDSRTYTPVVADAGKRIRVEVSFTDDADNPEGPLVSDPYPQGGPVVSSTALWSATLTVGGAGTGAIGYDSFADNPYGSLSSTQFTEDGETITIVNIAIDFGDNVLQVAFSRNLAGSAYTLLLDDVVFSLGGGRSHEFDASKLDWSIDDRVSAQLFGEGSGTFDPEDAAKLDGFWLAHNDNWVTQSPRFNRNTTRYTGTPPEDAERVTLNARPQHTDADIQIAGPGIVRIVNRTWDSGKRAVIDLPAEGGAWTATVTSPDGNHDKVYTYSVGARVAALASLTATPVAGEIVWTREESGAGGGATHRYWVTRSVSQVTLEAVASTSSGRVEMPDDANGLMPGVQVDINANSRTTFRIVVRDGSASTTHELIFNPLPSALTASVREIEPADGGVDALRFQLRLNAPVELSLSDWTSALDAGSSTITKVTRVGGEASGPDGDPVSATWRFTVEPADDNALTVSYTPTGDCAAAGAVCTPGDALELSALSHTFNYASIKDASANPEGGEMVFDVKLSKPRSRWVYIDFKTIDSGAGTGTATAGTPGSDGGDYWPQTTRLVIPPGETQVKAGVGLVTDSETADGKTINVMIENARTVDDDANALQAIPIMGGTATGTILSSRDCPANTTTHCSIAVGESVIGHISSSTDRDWYEVEFVSGKRYRIDLKGESVDALTLEDPRIHGIYDNNGTWIIGTANDDVSGTDLNSRVTYTATRTGTHYLAAAMAIGSPGTYELEVTIVDHCSADTSTSCSVTVGGSVRGEIEVVGDRDWYEVQFVSGKKYRIDLKGHDSDDALTLEDPYFRGIYDDSGTQIDSTEHDDISGSNFDSRVTYTATRTGAHYLSAGGADYSGAPLKDAIGTYELEVTIVDDCPADTGTTCSVTVGGTASGELEVDGDRDWYEVQFVSGKSYRIELNGAEEASGTLSDPYFFGIYDDSGTLIDGTADDDGDGITTGSQVTYSATRTGAHYLSAGGEGDLNAGTYELVVTAFDDDCTADTSTTCSVTVGGTASGELEVNGDRDWYEVQFVLGTKYRIDLKGIDNDASLTLSDPKIFGIYDNNGTLISGTTNDDGIGSTAGSRVTYTATRTGAHYLSAGETDDELPGTYELVVTVLDDCSADTSTGCSVTVGDSVRGELESAGDRDWYEVQFDSAKTYQIDLKGEDLITLTLPDPEFHGIHDNNGTLISGTTHDDISSTNLNSRVTYTATRTGAHYLAAGETDDADVGTYELVVTIVDACSADTGTTCSVTVGGSARGELEVEGDRDWFKVEFVSGTEYRIDLLGETLSDPFFYGIHDNNGTLISGTTNGDGDDVAPDSRVDYTATRTGAHYLAAGGHGDEEDGIYELVVTDLTDDCTADTSTTCSVTVDGSARGRLQIEGDRDWFKVQFDSARTYQIDLKGSGNDASLTVFDPEFFGIHDNNGTLISGTTNDDGIGGTNGSRVTHTATRTGAHYLSAGGFDDFETGTYELSVTIVDDCSADTSTTCSVTVGGSARGKLEVVDDRDWYEVQLDSARTYRIDLKGEDVDTLTLGDPRFFGIYNDDGTLIDGTEHDDVSSVNLNSQVTYTATRTGAHYLSAGMAIATDPGTYELSVTDVTGKSTSGPGNPKTPLTASFESVPNQHDGSTVFTVELVFSEVLANRSRSRLLSSLEVSGATLVDVRAVTTGKRDRWRIELDPESHEAVAVSLAAGGDCASVPCTEDARALSEEVSDTVQGPPVLSVADAEVEEGPGATLAFVVSLDRAASDTVTVDYATSDGGAEEEADYTAASGTLTFEPGDTLRTVGVPVLDDALDEEDETLALTLSNPANAALIDSTARGTILDDDEASPLTAAFESVPPDHDGSAAFAVGVEFSEAVTLTAASPSVSGGTVTGVTGTGEDGTSWDVTVEPSGESAVELTLPVAADCAAAGAICTADGRALSEAVTASIAYAAPEPLTASFADVPAEHDGSSLFEVRLVFSEAIASSNADRPSQDLKAAITTTGGDVKRVYRDDTGQWTDFLVRLAPAQDGPVTVAVRAPDAEEACSDMGVICTPDGRPLSQTVSDTVAGPGVTNSAATGEPTISGTARVGETLTASVSGISDADGLTGATFEYQWIRRSTDIEGATASAYTLVSADEGETIRVRVDFTDDNGNEESLTSAATGAVAPAQEPLTASFTDVPDEHDGSSAFTFRLAFSEAIRTGFEVLRDKHLSASGGTVTRARRVDGRSDLWEITVQPSGDEDVTVTLASGDRCSAAPCTTDGRALSETVTATIEGPSAAPPAVSVSDASATEGEAVEFTVSLSETAGEQVTVAYATSGGAAESGTDFTAESGTLTFAAGESSQTVSVSSTEDSLDEEDETFTLTLSSPVNATLGDATATGTITDDDGGAPLPALSVADAAVAEGPNAKLMFEITLDRAAAETVTVEASTSDGTATAGSDYRAKTLSKTFAPGETKKIAVVTVLNDSLVEGSETMTLTLSNASGAGLADSVATGTITDASSSSSDVNNGGDVMENDALAVVDGLTPEEATEALVGERTLSEAQRTALDRLGNRNGGFDLGDVLSWRDRCARGEARCGRSSTDPGPASAALFLLGAAARRRRRSGRPRRRGSGPRPARRAARALALLVAAAAAWSCTGDLVGPPAAESDAGSPAAELSRPAAAPQGPGFLTVEWTAPAGAGGRVTGVLLELEGPGIGAVVGAGGLELHHSAAGGRHRIVVAGPLESGPLLRFRVPDRGRLGLYRVRVLQVTGEDYALGDTGEYRAVAASN